MFDDQFLYQIFCVILEGKFKVQKIEFSTTNDRFYGQQYWTSWFYVVLNFSSYLLTSNCDWPIIYVFKFLDVSCWMFYRICLQVTVYDVLYMYLNHLICHLECCHGICLQVIVHDVLVCYLLHCFCCCGVGRD